jgi:hypothetical protein
MVALLVVLVSAAVLAFLYWWFANRWKPADKEWCVMFYLTSQVPRSSTPISRPDEETGVPAGATLDQKLDQVVDTIRMLPCSLSKPAPPWDNAYVAYRAIWADVQRDPEARVVSGDPAAPTATYFSGESIYDVGLAFDLSTDITDFFMWVYENCPANHYAVFFWGHAMGPGGLFQQSERPLVISPLVKLIVQFTSWLAGFTGTTNQWAGVPGIASLQKALHSVVVSRIAKMGGTSAMTLPVGALPTVPPPSSGSPGSSSASTTTPPQVLQVPKVEVVLFQDCWMAGIETAFELQDDVRYIVASQSIVPIGYRPGGTLGAVWPYQELIECMMAAPNTFGPQLLQKLEGFFNANPNNRWPMLKVLFSLMDCAMDLGKVTAALQDPFQKLVTALDMIGPEQRSKLIDQAFAQSGRLFEMDGNRIAVGDQALIDVPTMSHYLSVPTSWPANVVVSADEAKAIADAAKTLQKALVTVVVTNFESPTATTASNLPYSGLTALYKSYAIFGEDSYIVNNTYRSSYDMFRFATETSVPATVAGEIRSWADFAFERTEW